MPRFHVCRSQTWKFGNENQDDSCADSDIIWQVDLQEGKDHQPELGQKEYDEKGKTTGTLLRLTKPIHGTGKMSTAKK